MDPQQWGHGVGGLLYERAMNYLQLAGYEQASLWVLERNERARGWYERLGWTCTGSANQSWILLGSRTCGIRNSSNAGSATEHWAEIVVALIVFKGCKATPHRTIHTFQYAESGSDRRFADAPVRCH